MTKLYKRIASLITAIENCEQSGNADWKVRHESVLDAICAEFLPSGSGLDSGVTLIRETSGEDKLIFQADFHHMNADGFYTGWTCHTVIVTPSLLHDFVLKVTGRDKNGIKDYIADIMNHALAANVPETFGLAD